MGGSGTNNKLLQLNRVPEEEGENVIIIIKKVNNKKKIKKAFHPGEQTLCNFMCPLGTHA